MTKKEISLLEFLSREELSKLCVLTLSYVNKNIFIYWTDLCVKRATFPDFKAKN